VALTIADRVRETSTTTGTGSFTLAGAVAGFRTFSSGVGNTTTYYAIWNQDVQAEWEVGYGTISGGTTLARTSVIASSNSNAAVNFSAGTKQVFCDAPAEMLVGVDPSLCQGRLTLSDGVPVPTTDQTAAPGFFWTPCRGNRVSLYTGSRWRSYAFSQSSINLTTARTTFATVTGNTTSGSPIVTNLSAALSHVGMPMVSAAIPARTNIKTVDSSTQVTLTANAGSTATGTTITAFNVVYDVFLYDSGGTPTLEILAWTGNTTRATALTTQDGVLVKSGDASRRSLGTVRPTAPNCTSASLTLAPAVSPFRPRPSTRATPGSAGTRCTGSSTVRAGRCPSRVTRVRSPGKAASRLG
jgi:hypothetical protein